MTDKELAEKTSNAYSFDTYGMKAWTAAIRMMRRRGHTERNIEAVLRSKWTRWAADGRKGRVPTSKDIERFLDDPRNFCARDLEELTRETFEEGVCRKG